MPLDYNTMVDGLANLIEEEEYVQEVVRHTDDDVIRTSLVNFDKKEEQEDELDNQMYAAYDQLVKNQGSDPENKKFDILLRKDTKAKKAVERDPFLKFGVGIKNFFRLQVELIRIFALLSIIAIIQMIVFAHMDGLDFLGYDKVSFYARTSFGNMGYASSLCSHTIIDW